MKPTRTLYKTLQQVERIIGYDRRASKRNNALFDSGKIDVVCSSKRILQLYVRIKIVQRLLQHYKHEMIARSN